MKPTPFQKEILDSVHSIIDNAFHSNEFEKFRVTKDRELAFPVLLDEKARKSITKNLNSILKTVRQNGK